jgi:hypothetical protein
MNTVMFVKHLTPKKEVNIVEGQVDMGVGVTNADWL